MRCATRSPIKRASRNDTAMGKSTNIFALIGEFDQNGAVAAVRADPALVRARDGELGSTPLVFASHRGQLDVVRALLAAGAVVDDVEAASGTTSLHRAAEAGHAE